MPGFIPIPDVFPSVYADIVGYGRTKSASYRNWLQAKLFVYGTRGDGEPVRIAAARLKTHRTGALHVPAWWRPTKPRDRRIPPSAPIARRIAESVSKIAELRR